MNRPIIIAVDGVAGSGKSSICQAAAQKIDFVYISTGFFYRAIGYLAHKSQISLSDTENLIKLTEEFAKHFQWDFGQQKLFFADENITPFLNSEVAGQNASFLAAQKHIRDILLPIQRSLAQLAPKGMIIDGRDIGTVIFPDADLKVFMTASLEERAKRRLLQLELPVNEQSVQTMYQELEKRDQQDSQRQEAPLAKAKDAVVLDTTHLSIEDAIEQLCTLINNTQEKNCEH